MVDSKKSERFKFPEEKAISEYVKDINNAFLNGQYRPIITNIIFWDYKNIEDGSKLDFRFPISLLIGVNGANKTSVLRALQGSVAGDNLANYWFDSKLDLIPDNKRKPKYVYSYSLPLPGREEEYAQVMYQRVFRTDRKEKDYFETVALAYSRCPSKKIDFKNLGSKYEEFHRATRWNPVQKNACYIDIRNYPSAYEINMRLALQGFLYESGKFAKASSEKGYKKAIQIQKDRVRDASSQVSAIFNLANADDISVQKEFNDFLNESNIEKFCDPPVVLSDCEVEWIGYILGRKYKKITLLNHSFFGLPGTTVKVEVSRRKAESNFIEYSEAYAGSGEYAVIMMVHLIFEASDKSLLLMDEPENSLHPESQRRLMEYILMMSQTRKHQFVIATHSAYMAEEMPTSSMHHLYESDDKSIRMRSGVKSRDVFIGIGGASSTPMGKVNIKLEDKLAIALAKRALREYGEKESLSKYVFEAVGSSSEIITKEIPSDIRRKADDTLWILDGDMNYHNKNDIVSRLEKKLGPVLGYEYYACRVALYYVANSNSSSKNKSKNIVNGYDAVVAYLEALDKGNQVEISKCLDEVNKKVNYFIRPKGDAEKERVNRVQSVFEWLEKHVQYLPGDGNPESWILKQLGLGDSEGKKAKNEIASRQDEIRDLFQLMPDEDIDGMGFYVYQLSLLNQVEKEKIKPVFELINNFDK